MFTVYNLNRALTIDRAVRSVSTTTIAPAHMDRCYYMYVTLTEAIWQIIGAPVALAIDTSAAREMCPQPQVNKEYVFGTRPERDAAEYNVRCLLACSPVYLISSPQPHSQRATTASSATATGDRCCFIRRHRQLDLQLLDTLSRARPHSAGLVGRA